jgi:hypothetical protein
MKKQQNNTSLAKPTKQSTNCQDIVNVNQQIIFNHSYFYHSTSIYPSDPHLLPLKIPRHCPFIADFSPPPATTSDLLSLKSPRRDWTANWRISYYTALESRHNISASICPEKLKSLQVQAILSLSFLEGIFGRNLWI